MGENTKTAQESVDACCGDCADAVERAYFASSVNGDMQASLRAIEYARADGELREVHAWHWQPHPDT